MTATALILSQIDAIGAAEVSRRVAPLWGLALPEHAAQRLSRYRAHLEGRGGRDMASTALFALLSVLGLSIAPDRP